MKKYDYSQEGGYFVTVCTQGRECLFGEINDGEMVLNEHGLMVAEEWQRAGIVRRGIGIDVFIVMPNHFHGIIMIDRRGEAVPRPKMAGELRARHRLAPTGGVLGNIVGQFKSMTARRINVSRQTPGFPIWQRNYYEHIIRDASDLDRIREYITSNALKWETDQENPINLPQSPTPKSPASTTVSP